MKRLMTAILAALAALLPGASRAAPAADLIVVSGAPGTEEFGKSFQAAARAWESAATQGEATATVIGLDNAGTLDVKRLESAIRDAGADSPLPLWIVLIGHGTFDGREAKFNLRGQDVSAAEMAEWLKDFTRPVAIVNCSASSAPFLKTLSKPGRVIVTATKSGSEDSYARFGEHLAATIHSPDADLDRDGGTSLLEAFLAASKGVEEFYEKEGRIATEQALLDDNGDGFGTPAEWFRGVRAVKKAKDDAEPDGVRAHQFHLVPSEADRELAPEVRRQRDELESQLLALRTKKDSMEEEAYYRALEEIARQLAALYHPDAIAPENADPDS
jgi:hypothetical protein